VRRFPGLPHYDCYATGWRLRKLSLGERKINHTMATSQAAIQVAHHADHVVGILVVFQSLAENVPIPKKLRAALFV
jgi:hypothetical protein